MSFNWKGGLKGLVGNAEDQRASLIDRIVDKTNADMREGFHGLSGRSDDDIYIDAEDAEHLLAEYAEYVASVVESHDGENVKVALENVLGKYPKTSTPLSNQPEYYDLESHDKSRFGTPLVQQSFFDQLRKSGGGRALIKSIENTAISQHRQGDPTLEPDDATLG